MSISYRWARSLGGRPSDKTLFVEGRLDPDKCERTEKYFIGIGVVKTLAREGRIALMCSELKPQQCHRSYTLAVTLEKDPDFMVAHIDEHDMIKPQSHFEDHQARMF